MGEPMNDKDKVEAYISLYKQQMERFSKTQDVEWKGNFGIWALLAGGIYLASVKDSITFPLPLCWVAVFLTALCLVHLGWLFAVQRSERDDKERWDRYRARALDIICPNHGEKLFIYARGRQFFWLLLEAGMTVLLSIVLFTILHSHKTSSHKPEPPPVHSTLPEGE